MNAKGWIQNIQGHSHIGSILLERNNEKVTLLYKYNMSDEHWIGDENSKSFELMINETEFNPDFIEDSIPKIFEKYVLDNIELSIKGCSNRIILQDDKEKSEEINELFEELNKLRNPK